MGKLRSHHMPPCSTIDLNSASSSELQSLDQIGPKKAQQIIEHRPFDSLEDLQSIPGIGSSTLHSLISSPQVKLSPSISPTNSPLSSCSKPPCSARNLIKARKKTESSAPSLMSSSVCLVVAAIVGLTVYTICATDSTPDQPPIRLSSNQQFVEMLQSELAATKQQLRQAKQQLRQVAHLERELASHLVKTSETSSIDAMAYFLCPVALCALFHVYARASKLPPTRYAQAVPVVNAEVAVLSPQNRLTGLLRIRQNVVIQQRQ